MFTFFLEAEKNRRFRIVPVNGVEESGKHEEQERVDMMETHVCGDMLVCSMRIEWAD